MSMIPPPLPPQGEDTASTPHTTSPADTKPAASSYTDTRQADNNKDTGFEAETPKKSNKLLWLIPAAVILLLIGAGIYAYYYLQSKHEKEQKELQDEQAAQEEARLKREQEIADSIAAEQSFQDERRLGFSSPNLETFNLKGHVKSVMTSCSMSDDCYYPVLIEVFRDRSISYNYDGNFTQLAEDLKTSEKPSLSYNGAYLSDIRYNSYDDLNYSFTWSGNRITGAKQTMNDDVKCTDSYSAFDGNDPTSISESFSWTSNSDSRNSTKYTLTFTITYSDRDEYGNWTKAQVSYNGKSVNSWVERQEEYSNGYTYYNDIPKSESQNLNGSYTITRYIDYYDYVPENH